MTEKTLIAALHGPAGVGKDTTADFLVQHHGFEKIAFADGIYRSLATMFNREESWLRSRDKDTPDQWLALLYCEEPEYREWMFMRKKQDLLTPRTSRYHAIHYGNEFVPGRLGADYWVRRAMERIESSDAARIVIPDLRTYRDRRELRALTELCARKPDKYELKVVALTETSAPYSDLIDYEQHESAWPLPAAAVHYQLVAERNQQARTFAAIESWLFK